MSLFRKNTSVATAPEPAPPVTTTAVGINLTKGGSAGIKLTKDDAGAFITAHLDWDGGSASRRSCGADLELYVLYVPKADVGSGRDTVGNAIYYRSLGNTNRPPYIKHHGDSLTPGRETATIGRLGEQGYALVCAYSAVGNGVGSFKSYGAQAIVTDGAGQTVTVPLYDNNRHAYWVAIALVDFTGDGAVISQVEKYSRAGSENRPVLHSDGRVEMDAGPVEFK
ncbi:hypothetical protein ACIRU8_39065 [Streptomyces sp. NPDC101175]|uniref:hypothetical protein n=1 Tax=Streptomyces sp. NPDC101175 TaxID=3366123 RepID=UPI003834A603